MIQTTVTELEKCQVLPFFISDLSKTLFHATQINYSRLLEIFYSKESYS